MRSTWRGAGALLVDLLLAAGRDLPGPLGLGRRAEGVADPGSLVGAVGGGLVGVRRLWHARRYNRNGRGKSDDVRTGGATGHGVLPFSVNRKDVEKNIT